MQAEAKPSRPWPEDHEVFLVKVNRREVYRTPDGDFPRVTTISGFSALGKDALIGWAAETERNAAIEAAIAAVSADALQPPDSLRADILSRIGPVKAHLKAKQEAAEIGSQIHDAACWHLRRLTDQPLPRKPVLSDPARLGFVSWLRWWEGAGLRPVRSEQKVWSRELGVAGTVDLIAESDEGVGVVDFKSSGGIYDSFHLQVAAYAESCRRWADIRWAKIVRFPKYADDPLVTGGEGFKSVDLGDLSYTTKGGKRVERRIPEAELLRAVAALRECYRVMEET